MYRPEVLVRESGLTGLRIAAILKEADAAQKIKGRCAADTGYPG